MVNLAKMVSLVLLANLVLMENQEQVYVVRLVNREHLVLQAWMDHVVNLDSPVDLVKMDEKVKLLLVLLVNLVYLVKLVLPENQASQARMENLDVMLFSMKVTIDSKKVLLVFRVNLVEMETLVKEACQVFPDSLEKMADLAVFVHLDQKALPVKMVKMV